MSFSIRERERVNVCEHMAKMAPLELNLLFVDVIVVTNSGSENAS